MGELGARLGLNELSGGAAGIGRAVLAEFIGNLLLNLFGCGACVNITNAKATADIVLIALAFGLAVFAIVSAIGHISGGHVNPAVTAGLLATGRVKPIRAVLYVIAQCAGAAAGSGLLKALTPDRAAPNGIGVTSLGTEVTELQGFGIEFFLGFVLIFVVCGVCDPHKPDSKATAPLAIGLTVTLGHLLAVDYTGSAMNPARSFGSALVANVWTSHWVYWAGPVAGGVAAALLYVHGFSAPPPDTTTTPRYRPVAAADEKELKRLDGKPEDLA